MNTSTEKKLCSFHLYHDNYFNGECQWCILEERNKLRIKCDSLQRLLNLNADEKTLVISDLTEVICGLQKQVMMKELEGASEGEN